MKEEVDTLYHRLETLTENNSRARMLLSNPFMKTRRDVYQISGNLNGSKIASVGIFNLRILADGISYDVIGGGGLNVAPEYRHTGYALELYEYMKTISPDKVFIGYGLSQKARKLARAMGAAVFDVSRFLCIRKSRYFMENYMPRHNNPIKTAILDVICWFHRRFVAFLTRIKTFQLKVEHVGSLDTRVLDDYAGLVAMENKRFRQDVTTGWIEWILNNDFIDPVQADKRLFRVSIGNNRVGYFITRYSKEGRLGCVIDWQIDGQHLKYEPWILLRAMFTLFPKAHAVALAVSKTESRTTKVLKRLLVPCPDQVAEVAPGDDSPLVAHDGWRDQTNWRIRPSMGDGAFY